MHVLISLHNRWLCYTVHVQGKAHYNALCSGRQSLNYSNGTGH